MQTRPCRETSSNIWGPCSPHGPVQASSGRIAHEERAPAGPRARRSNPRSDPYLLRALAVLQRWGFIVVFGVTKALTNYQAGLVNNVNDGMAWGLFPLFFAAARRRHGSAVVITALV